MNPSESAVRKVIAQIEPAWRNKEDENQTREKGSDQLVFQLTEGRWQLIWRYMFFAPSD